MEISNNRLVFSVLMIQILIVLHSNYFHLILYIVCYYCNLYAVVRCVDIAVDMLEEFCLVRVVLFIALKHLMFFIHAVCVAVA